MAHPFFPSSAGLRNPAPIWLLPFFQEPDPSSHPMGPLSTYQSASPPHCRPSPTSLTLTCRAAEPLCELPQAVCHVALLSQVIFALSKCLTRGAFPDHSAWNQHPLPCPCFRYSPLFMSLFPLLCFILLFCFCYIATLCIYLFICAPPPWPKNASSLGTKSIFTVPSQCLDEGWHIAWVRGIICILADVLQAA